MSTKRSAKRVMRRRSATAAIPLLPDPLSLNRWQLEQDRQARKSFAREAVRAAREWGSTPRDRLSRALQRIEQHMLGGLDQKPSDELRVRFRRVRAERDSRIPVLKHEARARTFRRRRAALALELGL